jgi:hypothetical protein
MQIHSFAVRRWFSRVCIAVVQTLLVVTAAGAQFGGDSFSAGSRTDNSIAVDYLVEFEDLPPADSPKLKVTRSENEIIHGVNSIGPADPFASALAEDNLDADDEFSRGTNNEFFDRPLLSGATHGTIGPQWTHLPGWLSRYVERRRVDFTFFSGVPSPYMVRRALREQHVAEPAVIKKVSSAPGMGNWSLSKILRELTRIENGGIARRQIYAVTKGKQLLSTVYLRENSSLAMAFLHECAAKLEKSALERQIHLGTAAGCRKQWQSAWAHYEQVYKMAAKQPAVLKRVAHIYSGFSRDTECCVWLTRYLRVVKTWDEFEIAQIQRNRIERKWTEVAGGAAEVNATWPENMRTLKVCFLGSNQANYDPRLTETARDCLFDWLQALGGKLDYVETDDPKAANIVICWTDPVDRYRKFLNSKMVPTAAPELERLGETDCVLRKDPSREINILRATIRVPAPLAGSRVIGDELLRAICLHEIGHALGIERHIREEAACMSPYCNVNLPELDLRRADVDTVKTLYCRYPVIQTACDHFFGMRAQQEKLVVTLSSCK